MDIDVEPTKRINVHLSYYIGEIQRLYQAMEGYIDELEVLLNFPDIYWDDPRIYSRVLERVFQLIVDGVISLSIIYTIGRKPRNKRIENWKIVSWMSQLIDNSVVDRFSGEGQYISKRNNMVHEDPFQGGLAEFEKEAGQLAEATKLFIDQLKVVCPCPNCEGIIISRKAKNVRSEWICKSCYAKYRVISSRPFIIELVRHL